MTPLIYTNKIKAFSAYLCLCSLVALVLLVFAQQAQAQAGRNPVSARRTTVLPLNVRFTEDKTKPRSQQYKTFVDAPIGFRAP